jgi:hypothetical protein
MKLSIHIVRATATHHDGGPTNTIRYAIVAESGEHAIDRLKREHDIEGWSNFATVLSYETLGPPHGSIVCLDGEIWNARLAR